MSTVVVHGSQPGATTLLDVATRYSPPGPVTSSATTASCDSPIGASTTARSSASSTCRWPALWPTACMYGKRWFSARAADAGSPVSLGSSTRCATGAGGGAGRNTPEPASDAARAGGRRRGGPEPAAAGERRGEESGGASAAAVERTRKMHARDHAFSD